MLQFSLNISFGLHSRINIHRDLHKLFLKTSYCSGVEALSVEAGIELLPKGVLKAE